LFLLLVVVVVVVAVFVVAFFFIVIFLLVVRVVVRQRIGLEERFGRIPRAAVALAASPARRRRVFVPLGLASAAGGRAVVLVLGRARLDGFRFFAPERQGRRDEVALSCRPRAIFWPAASTAARVKPKPLIVASTTAQSRTSSPTTIFCVGPRVGVAWRSFQGVPPLAAPLCFFVQCSILSRDT
jgi:hypothetical protein